MGRGADGLLGSHDANTIFESLSSHLLNLLILGVSFAAYCLFISCKQLFKDHISCVINVCGVRWGGGF